MKKTISILCLLAVTVCSGREMNAYDIVMKGQELSAAETEQLEKKVAETPEDLEARKQLLGYYFMRQYQDASAKAARQRHVLWIIEHAPEDGVHATPYTQLNKYLDGACYEQGGELWKKQVAAAPENVAVYGHAANYFELHSPMLAEQYLMKSAELDPKNPEWPKRLGQLYSHLNTGTPKQIAEKELEQLEKSYALSAPMDQGYLLADMAKAAVAAEQYQKAKQYAEQMLSNQGGDWNSGNNMHHGNMVLGLVALHDGDIDAAKKYLILSGKTKGSPQLDSFGPNMTLAKALAEKGETDAVLEYFDLCSNFWKMHRGRLADWSALVKEDRIPDFGANLKY